MADVATIGKIIKDVTEPLVETINALRTEMKNQSAGLLNAINEQKRRTTELEAEVSSLRAELTNMQAREMRNNVILKGPGVPLDRPGNDYNSSKEFVASLFREAGLDTPTIERAHHFGNRDRPRPIVAKS